MAVPDSVANEIHRAVEAAMNAGVRPSEFVAAVREAWTYEHHERRKVDEYLFDRMLKA